MPNKLAHFAIEAEDVERARVFYEAVFGWVFEAWGPPGFYLIQGAGVHGALQQRAEPLGPGPRGFPCTFAVDNLSHTMGLVSTNGGTVAQQRHKIPTVGELLEITDPEGNVMLIMQYEPDQLRSMNL